VPSELDTNPSSSALTNKEPASLSDQPTRGGVVREIALGRSCNNSYHPY